MEFKRLAGWVLQEPLRIGTVLVAVGRGLPVQSLISEQKSALAQRDYDLDYDLDCEYEDE